MDWTASRQARCLMRAASHATLATIQGEQPFAALVTPAIAADGDILLLLSSLSRHCQQLGQSPRCAVFFLGVAENLNPQTAPRVSVLGTARLDPDPALRRRWVARHPYARLYADFTDFAMWRVTAAQGFWVGGFAQACPLAGPDLRPPPSAAAAFAAGQDALVAGCNRDFGPGLNRLAHAAGAAGNWQLLAVDYDGFELAQDEARLWLPWETPVDGLEGVAAALGACPRTAGGA